MFVIVPIAAIHLTWNSLSNVLLMVPQINPWQAALLYVALICVIYLTGLVRIEVVRDEKP